MALTADCINTKSKYGQNLTPPDLIEVVHEVFQTGIDLDPASDNIANQYIKAKKFYTLSQDGYTKPWSGNNVWLNPPGKSRTKTGDFITASDWARKLMDAYLNQKINNAMYLAYRGGSIGSLGLTFLKHSLMCMTAAGSENVSGSGRISYLIFNGEELIPETSNTQCSAIFLLSKDEDMRSRFASLLNKYGVVFSPL